MKITYLQIALWIAIGCLTAPAQDFRRFEFQPLGGYTASGDISLETGDHTEATVQVNSSYNVGAAFGVYLNELDSIEASWQRQFTDGWLPPVIANPALQENPVFFNLKIDRFHGNFLHHFKTGNPDAKPYVMAGLGWKTYHGTSGGQTGSKSYFSFALGGGIKYFFTSHFGLKGEARWSPSVLSASGSGIWCGIGGEGAGCLVEIKALLHHQMDITGGAVFRF